MSLELVFELVLALVVVDNPAADRVRVKHLSDNPDLVMVEGILDLFADSRGMEEAVAPLGTLDNLKYGII